MPKRRRKTRALISGNVIIEHPLVTIARREPEVRKRRFIMALARTLEHMNGDDLGQIEPVLQRIIGRVVIESIDAGLVP